MESIHKTVLLNETIDGLLVPSKVEGNKNLIVLDCTFGGGGHSLGICRKFPGVRVIALDQDKSAFQKAEYKFKDLDCDIKFINSNFRDIDKVLAKENPGGVDAVIFDLGLSSDQLENSGRGFSFMKDEPLLMTMKENPLPEDLTAYDVVNTWGEKSLADIIYGYGEEKLSRRIAKAIVESRGKASIKTTFDLVKIIETAVGRAYKRQKVHCATRTFQAIRIAVNDELGSLDAGLHKAFDSLKPGGRMSVISFHSLEDRIVKRFYQGGLAKKGEAILINKKPIIPGAEELKANPRARSAKLRILEKK
ncbi:MAG TPA: 16S rRNA (cytosine(1402)-N(4))-methyltransferase RsmH [Candidatus Paceibacterota bacterium]